MKGKSSRSLEQQRQQSGKNEIAQTEKSRRDERNADDEQSVIDRLRSCRPFDMRHFSLCFIDIIDDFHIFLVPILMTLYDSY